MASYSKSKSPSLVWLGIAWAACGAAPDAPIKTGPKIEEVSVIGNSTFSDDEIVDGLSTHPPKGWVFRDYAYLDQLNLDSDKDRIEVLYARRGYFNTEVSEPTITEEGDGVRVIYTLREGPPTVIAQSTASGIPSRAAELDGLVKRKLEVGTRFRYSEYEGVKNRMVRELRTRGYAYGDVQGEVLVDRSAHSASVSLDVKPGPVARFGEVEIVTNAPELSEAIRHRIAWKKGQRFSPALIARTRDRLHATQRFNQVLIRYDRDTPAQEVKMTVEAAEGLPRRIQLGGGIAADPTHWEVRGRASYSVSGLLFDPLSSAKLSVSPAYEFLRDGTQSRAFTGEARAELRRIDLFAPRLLGLGTAVYDSVAIEPYTRRGPELALALERPIWSDRFVVRGGWQIARYTFSNIHPALMPSVQQELRVDGPLRVASFSQEARLDFRDDPLDARRGFYSAIRFEEGGTYAGGEPSFTIGRGDLRGYLPLTSRWMVAARTHYARSLRGSLPATRRLYSGGGTSHRGFALRELSPRVSDGDSSVQIGGEERLETSVETRYDLFQAWGEWVAAAVFVDGGDVTDRNLLEPVDLHWAAGFGLRYDTIVGPVRADFGHRFTRLDDPPERKWAVHFSLGQPF